MMSRLEQSVRAHEQETLSDKLARECCLLSQVIPGVSDAGKELTSDWVSTTAKVGVAAGAGLMLERAACGVGWGSTLAKTAGAAMGAAFVMDLANNRSLSRLGSAMTDAWQSSNNFERDCSTVRHEGGRFVTDAAIMVGAGAVAVGGKWLQRQRVIHQPVVPFDPPMRGCADGSIEYNIGDGVSMLRKPDLLEIALPSGHNHLFMNEWAPSAIESYKSLSGKSLIRLNQKGSIVGEVWVTPNREVTYKDAESMQRSDLRSNTHISERYWGGKLQDRSIYFRDTSTVFKHESDGSITLRRPDGKFAKVTADHRIEFNPVVTAIDGVVHAPPRKLFQLGPSYAPVPKLELLTDGTHVASYGKGLRFEVKSNGAITMYKGNSVTELQKPGLNEKQPSKKFILGDDEIHGTV
jgi:hypothetical protein